MLYQSAEDPELKYKDYIEDILLGLSLQGSILVPEFANFRAHHNKVFMEIMRDIVVDNESQDVTSKSYGTHEEYERFYRPRCFPVVMKASNGSKSRNVVIARNKQEADRWARRLSTTPSFFNLIMGFRNWLDWRRFTPISTNRGKFIIQNFVPNLSGDYKVLVYGDKYFVLFRENRQNDFRASGSGKLSFPREIPTPVLTFARRMFQGFDVPYISMDIGYNGKKCYLFEFQFVMFGQYALEQSPCHFVDMHGAWSCVEGTTRVETELVCAVDRYIRKKFTMN